jgi:hypothetical protein
MLKIAGGLRGAVCLGIAWINGDENGIIIEFDENPTVDKTQGDRRKSEERRGEEKRGAKNKGGHTKESRSERKGRARNITMEVRAK